MESIHDGLAITLKRRQKAELFSLTNINQKEQENENIS